MFSFYNTYISLYVYLPEIFLGISLLLLFIFLLYDRIESFVFFQGKVVYKKKLVSINTALTYLVYIILIFVGLLYTNNNLNNFEGDVFSVTPLVIFTKKFFLVISFLIFILFSKYTYKGLSFELYLSFILIFFSSVLLLQINNLISFYVLIELQSIVLYLLIAFDRTSSISAEAGLKYFLMSIFMSIFFLLGVALIYITFGTTNLSLLSLMFYKLTDIGLALYGLVLIITFILFKLAVVPFHFWALEVYEGASWPVIGVLAVLSKIPLILFLIKLILIFGLDFNFNLNFILVMLNLLGFCSVFIGTFGAVYYLNLRKIIVYSGIANVGYVLLALGSSNFLAVVFVYIFFIIYSMVLVLLLYLFLFAFGSNFKDYTFQFTGLAVRARSLSFVLLLLFFILVGLPPLAGFWTKFLLLYSMMYSGSILKVIFVFLSNILSAVYYLRVIREMYFGKNIKNQSKINTLRTGLDLFFLFVNLFFIFVITLFLINFSIFIWIILSLFI